MPTFDSSGVTINYEDEGEGPPIVLVHGFACALGYIPPPLPGLRPKGIRPAQHFRTVQRNSAGFISSCDG